MKPRVISEPQLLIAHRGVPAIAPEGSARGFMAALASGALAVELDVRPTADGLLVVCHDDTPERLTGEPRHVWEQSADQLAAHPYLDAPDQRLLLLDEVLALLLGRAFIDIELKPCDAVPQAEMARMLFEALQRAGSPRSVVVTSEAAGLLAEIKSHAPLLATGLVFRSQDSSDGVARAAEMGCSVLAANQTHVTPELCAEARARELAVWAYTVNDPEQATALFADGADAVFTDDHPRLAAALGQHLIPRDEAVPRPSPAAQAVAGDRPSSVAPILAIDLGSTLTKVALVDPHRGLLARRVRPTPVARPRPGWVEHDATAQLAVVRELIAELAALQPEPPVAAALASQRSTGLWVREDLTPATTALSWQDERGAEVVAALAAERVHLEAVTGLPLLPSFGAVKARVLLGGSAPRAGERFLPLGSFVAAALTGAALTNTAPRADPTLANRMYLITAAEGQWSPELLERFGLTHVNLPELVPSVSDHGVLPWGASGQVPLRVLIGDQQAAYIGVAGPTGTSLVVNVGSATFVMKTWRQGNPLPRLARRAPLWTSTAKPTGGATLLELPVLEPLAREAQGATSTEVAMLMARRLAQGDETLPGVASEIRRAVSSLVAPSDRSVILAGGHLACPQIRHLLAETLPLEALETAERDLTLLGAARLAAAGAAIPWSLEGGGGVNPIQPPPEQSSA